MYNDMEKVVASTYASWLGGVGCGEAMGARYLLEQAHQLRGSDPRERV